MYEMLHKHLVLYKHPVARCHTKWSCCQPGPLKVMRLGAYYQPIVLLN